MHNRLCVNN